MSGELQGRVRDPLAGALYWTLLTAVTMDYLNAGRIVLVPHARAADLLLTLLLVRLIAVVMETSQPPTAVRGRMPLKACRAAPSGWRGKRVRLVMTTGFGVGMLTAALGVRAGSELALDPSKVKNLLPLEQIIVKARLVHDGQLIEAELKERHGIDIYETEILDDGGRVWEMHFNARTGKLMQQSEEGDPDSDGYKEQGQGQ